MNPFFSKLVDTRNATIDASGIVVVNDDYGRKDIAVSKAAWEHIYSFSDDDLQKDRADFDTNKLKDHLTVIERPYSFGPDSVYLEIGCGPAHIAEYLMRTKNVWFIGVDFNYKLLQTLQRHLIHKGYTKFLLIHADINNIPLIDNSVDYIYGGGVIEHLADTKGILKELYRVLKSGGVSFNSVPAFDAWWLFRIFNNIPYGPLRPLFEFFHLSLIHGAILKKFYGYELSYSASQLKTLHHACGYHDVTVGPLAFHPSHTRLGSKLLRSLYYSLQRNVVTCAVYYCYAVK